MMQQFQAKKYKAEYLQLQQAFITDLRNMSIDLKQVASPKRFDHLMVELNRVNNWIQTNIRSLIQTPDAPRSAPLSIARSHSALSGDSAELARAGSSGA
jgi:hypothetical protein